MRKKIYWLLKSEPETFSIDTLQKKPKKTSSWDGVRNYQARNMMRDEMKKGDLAFFYHSSCAVPGIAGIVEIVRESYPDYTAFDPQSPYFDPKSTQAKPRWYMVDVTFVKKFSKIIPLTLLRSIPELQHMIILKRGNRLSITPVSKEEWKKINLLSEELS